MTNLSRIKSAPDLSGAFNGVGKDHEGGTHKPERAKRQKKPTTYVTLRVTPEEKDALRQAAGALGLSAYIRERVFGPKAKARRSRGRTPVKDHAALARVLSALGHTGLSQDYNLLSWAVEEGTLVLDEHSNEALRQACADIAAIRRDLMIALGMKAKSR